MGANDTVTYLSLYLKIGFPQLLNNGEKSTSLENSFYPLATNNPITRLSARECAFVFNFLEVDGRYLSLS